MHSDKLMMEVSKLNGHCPAGERAGTEYLQQGKIPVISCEGGCIRGDIARLAANAVARVEPFRRGCHGKLFTMPQSALSEWMKNSGTLVLIDGCFLRCHGRIVENLLPDVKLIQFDAYSYYKKFGDCYSIDEASEEDRKAMAAVVAEKVLAELSDVVEGQAN